MRQSTLHAIEMIKNFRFGSNFFKYFRWLLLCIMIPFLLICLLIYNTYVAPSVQNSYRHMEQSHQQSQFAIDNLLENIQNKYFELYLSYEFQSFMTQKNNSGFSTSNYVRIISDIMAQMLNSTELIDSIDVYSSYNNYIFSNRYSGSLEAVSPHWLAAYQMHETKTFSAVTQSAKNRLLAISIDVSYNKTSYGMIVFNIHLDKLEKLMLSSHSEPIFYAALTDSEKTLIYSDNPEYAASYLPLCSDSTDGKSYLASPLFLPNLTFWSLINPEIVSRSKTLMYTMLALLILLSVILPFALALFLSLNNYMLISKITYQLQQITNIPIDLSEDSNEMVYITRNLQDIIKDRKQFEDTLTEKIATLKKSQTLALQSQISPHFLFNTLNIISMEMSNELGHDSQLVEMVSLLSDILSYALNSHEYFASFHEEIESVQKYIKIEQLKYYDSFDVSWSISNNISPDCKVAKFMLQPIIENCFEHAIHQLTDRRGKIEICVFRDNGDLVFTIEDNGVGISESNLERLKQDLNTMDLPNPHHIGLCNVNSRIALLFGEKYKLNIASYQGTKVTIRIPYTTRLYRSG